MTWLQTYSGKAFDLAYATWKEVCLEDLAHSLSQINRFNGHTNIPYTVAEHSVRVSMRLEEHGYNKDYLVAGLLHDAHEAYVGDLIRPVIDHLSISSKRDFMQLKAHLDEIIAEWADIEPCYLSCKEVQLADMELLATEARDLLGPPPRPWDEKLPEPLPGIIVPTTTPKAMFLGRFMELGLWAPP